MYIIELIIKYLKGKKYTTKNKYNPIEIIPDGLEEKPEDCEHLFMPLDSSEEIFGCKYCGLVVSKENLKKHLSD
jgi:hypothetical protein